MLSELYRYVSENTTASDTASVKLTLKYLEACNKMFEKGLLSHKRITSVDSEVLTSINTGFQYFVSWHKDLAAKGLCLWWFYVTIQNVCDSRES